MGVKLHDEYNKDFYAWALHNAKLIRQGKLSEVDLEHVAEEIESMGKSDRSKLASRLAVLMAHLLKWQYQPNLRSKSWLLTIKEQRVRINQLLKQSPSLRYQIDSTLQDAYERALIIAERESGLDESTFPIHCPFNLEQCLNQEFVPE